jgi:hypothetical protein
MAMTAQEPNIKGSRDTKTQSEASLHASASLSFYSCASLTRRAMLKALTTSGFSSLLGRGEAVPALRPAGILPAVENKGKMPSPRSKS